MTTIINLFGAPGAGKSTTRAGVFYRLKLMGCNVEEVPEVAKDFTWEERRVALACAPYVFGKQLRNMTRLLGKVDIIITDSPPLLASYYAEKYGDYHHSFHEGIFEITDAYNGPETQLNFFLQRVKPYNPAGRNQTEEESDAIGRDLEVFLHRKGITYTSVRGDESAVETILGRLRSLRVAPESATL